MEVSAQGHDSDHYQVIIVGSGPAGLQAGINLARARRSVLLLDRGNGRSAFVPAYHNLLGFPSEIPGRELLQRGRAHAARFGARILDLEVRAVNRTRKGRFLVHAVPVTGNDQQPDDPCQPSLGHTFTADRLIFATGLIDRQPPVKSAHRFAGHSIHYCPDCDGYEVIDQPTVVVGEANSALTLAGILLRYTRQLYVVNIDPDRPIHIRSRKYPLPAEIPVYNSPLEELRGRGHRLAEVLLRDGTRIPCRKMFSALGARKVNSDLATSLGVRVLKDGHIPVNRHTQETNVRHVWAIGDVAASTQQVCTGLGEAVTAATWINKSFA